MTREQDIDPSQSPHRLEDRSLSSENAPTAPSFKIENLKANPEWVDAIAVWHHHEWSKNQKNASEKNLNEKLQERIRLLQRHLNDDPLPSTFVAHENGRAIATVSLVYYQFSEQTLPSEWLTNLYVEPQYRQNGIASELLRCAIKHAQSIDLPRLLLYTSDCGPFYLRRQWQRVNTGIVQGRSVEIMEYKLQ